MVGEFNVNNETCLRYKKTGHGEHKVLVVPGGPGLTLEYLEPFHTDLDPDKFTVYSYDISGSSTCKGDYLNSFEEYADELKHFIEEFDLQNATLIGHSCGAVMALELAKNYPELGDRYILVNPLLSGNEVRNAIRNRIKTFPEDFQHRLKEAEREKSEEKISELIGEYWIGSRVYRNGDLPEALEKAANNYFEAGIFRHYFGYNFFDMHGAMTDWKADERVLKSNKPMMIMAGTEDYFTVEEIKNMRDKFQNCELWLGKDASHMPFWETRQEFMEKVEDFILSDE